ncbi:RnaseH [uncultured Caudovirales phage]|uniref:RnaseH n=1 Tax=uncultured Caudovirales phage TaxID=2100421 RepID=A0A6J5KQF9_9CAUD|nr:RnaseH [uncultured Caudovirales phage]
MILVDYSQTALNAILSFQKELKGNDAEIVNLCRHVILSSFQNIKRKYAKEYGEIVVCCDGRSYWRKEVFEFYKGNRKKSREASDLPWQLIFDTMSSIREDLRNNFPYKVVHFDRAEADDIIAVLSKWTQDNGLIMEGLEETQQKVLIISSDHDFKQLHRFPNVRQWSPRIKKFIERETDYMTNGHIQHIVKASDDGIPNILSADNVLVTEGVRQKTVSAKRLAEFLELGFAACRTDDERRNWHRNERLIDFKFIPEDISESIVEQYLNTKVVKDRMQIMNYLIQHRCRLLLDTLEDF